MHVSQIKNSREMRNLSNSEMNDLGLNVVD